MTKYKSDEMSLSKAVCSALRIHKFFVFHPGNEGRRTMWEVMQWKANGGIAGVADLIIVLHGVVVFVELKTAKGRQNPAQKEFQSTVECLGHRYEIWRTLDDALAFIDENKSRKITATAAHFETAITKAFLAGRLDQSHLDAIQNFLP